MLECHKVVSVNLLGKSKCSVDNIRVQGEEVLGDGAGTRVLAVQTGDGHSGGAVKVLLEVDAAHGEDGTLKLGERGVEFRGQAVLQNETGEQVVVSDQGQELGGTRVDVWGVQATRVEEDASRRDAQVCQDGEVGAESEIDLATHACVVGRRVGGFVEVELQADVASGDFFLDVLEAGDGAVGCEELGDDTAAWRWVGNHAGAGAAGVAAAAGAPATSALRIAAGRGGGGGSPGSRLIAGAGAAP